MRRFAVHAVVAAGVVAFLGGAGRSAATGAEICAASGPSICISVSGDPATVPPSEAGSPHYVSYVSQIANRGTSSATHLTADAAFPQGVVIVSATTGAGICSIDAHPTCTLANLAGGATASVEFVAQAPETEGTFTATVTATYDEHTNDSPAADPKQDHVSASEDTTVESLSGSSASFVPKGASVELSTDPTDSGVATANDPLIGQAVITQAPADVTAIIEEVTAPLACPKKVICRGGDWLHASIPGTYDPPLAFPARWDKTLIPTGLNSAKKFAVIYTECLSGCPLQVISAQCSSATPRSSELPCLTGVARLADGDWVGTVLNSHNGYFH